MLRARSPMLTCRTTPELAVMPAGSMRVCVLVSAHSYPERISSQGSHHGQKQRLLQESKHSADQRLHACKTAKLGGGIPYEMEEVTFSFIVGSLINEQYTNVFMCMCVWECKARWGLTQQHRGHQQQSEWSLSPQCVTQRTQSEERWDQRQSKLKE